MMKLQSEVSTKQTRRQLGDGGGTTKTQLTRVSTQGFKVFPGLNFFFGSKI